MIRSFRRSETEKKAAPSGGRSGFDDFGTTSQPAKKNDFTDFSTFDNFAQQKPQQTKQTEQFSGFGDFGNFSQSQVKQPETQKPQPNKQASLGKNYPLKFA